MEKQYVYISQEDLDEYVPNLRGNTRGQKDVFGVPLEFAAEFWGKDDVRGKIAMAQQGLNVAGTGSISVDIESSFFDVIKEQKEKNICFSSLGEAAERMMPDEEFFICASFRMGINFRGSSPKFIQLENDHSPCIYKGEHNSTRIVMGMSVSKMLMSMGELGDGLRYNSLDVWGRIYKVDMDPEPPKFQFKPFVTGFNWISFLGLDESD